MRQGFSSNAYEDGTHPIARDVKRGDLVELVFSHPHDGEIRCGGYVSGFNDSHLYLSIQHPDVISSRPRNIGIGGAISLQTITE
ncbi:hypothetical protein HY448_00590, partial [Candidatus Pacearchaeota archaeon]|nr:hypothetical protein [Candidatus Pacearchaeota archaeon]